MYPSLDKQSYMSNKTHYWYFSKHDNKYDHRVDSFALIIMLATCFIYNFLTIFVLNQLTTSASNQTKISAFHKC